MCKCWQKRQWDFSPIWLPFQISAPDHCGHGWFWGGALRDVRVVCSLAHPTEAHPTSLIRLATHQVHPCLCLSKDTHRLADMLERTVCGCEIGQIPLPLLIQSWQTYYGRNFFKAEMPRTFIRIQVREILNPLAPANSMLQCVCSNLFTTSLDVETQY